MAYPTTLALIAALWTGEGRTRTIALWSALGGAISSLGPLLSGFLLEPPDNEDYPRLAEALGLRVNTLAVAVHRLRQRLRELVRDEVLHTVSNQGDLEAELDGLRSAFRSLS